MAEKFARMKVRVNDSEKDQMGLLDALEALLIGITGKEALWSALEAASENVASLRGMGLRAAAATCTGTMRPGGRQAVGERPRSF